MVVGVSLAVLRADVGTYACTVPQWAHRALRLIDSLPPLEVLRALHCNDFT